MKASRASGCSGVADAWSRYGRRHRRSRVPGEPVATGWRVPGREGTRSEYRTAAMTAPAIGPTIQTYQSSQRPPTSAGPNQRAGFIAAPVNGPNAMMSNAITSPTVNPAVLFQRPVDHCVPKTAKTRKNVQTASMTIRRRPRPQARAPARRRRRRRRRPAPTRYRSRKAPPPRRASGRRSGPRPAGVLSLPADPQTDRDRRIHQTAARCAGDATIAGEHQPVRERDAHEVEPGTRRDHRAGPDEDQRERRDELGDRRLARLSTRPPCLVPRSACPSAAGRRYTRRSRLTGCGAEASSIARVDVLLVSPDARSRELMGLVVRSIERRLGEQLRFRAAANGEPERGPRSGTGRTMIVADEIASREGAFALARTLAGPRGSLPRRDRDPARTAARRVARQVVGRRRVVREARRSVRARRPAARARERAEDYRAEPNGHGPRRRAREDQGNVPAVRPRVLRRAGRRERRRVSVGRQAVQRRLRGGARRFPPRRGDGGTRSRTRSSMSPSWSRSSSWTRTACWGSSGTRSGVSSGPRPSGLTVAAVTSTRTASASEVRGEDGTWRVAILGPDGDEVSARACRDEAEARTYASTVRQHIEWLSPETFREYYRDRA